MPTGTPGKFGGGVKGSKGSYDTATQTFRKPGKSKKGGKGKGKPFPPKAAPGNAPPAPF